MMQTRRKRVVVTGSSGRIGALLCNHLKASDRFDLVEIADAGPPSVLQADLRRYSPDWAIWFEGADAVVHLASNPTPTIWWDDDLCGNFDMVLNVFHAAAAHAVPRVVIASSVWAMYGQRFDSGYCAPDRAPDPGVSAYGAMKVFSERVARSFHEATGISTVALRIGSFVPEPFASSDPGLSRWAQECWLSPTDLCRGVERAIVAPNAGFAVVNLCSANCSDRWNSSQEFSKIGYVPETTHIPNVALRRKIQERVARVAYFQLPSLIKRFVAQYW